MNLKQLLEDLVAWDIRMGGHEDRIWQRTRRHLAELRAQDRPCSFVAGCERCGEFRTYDLVERPGAPMECPECGNWEELGNWKELYRSDDDPSAEPVCRQCIERRWADPATGCHRLACDEESKEE